MEDTDPKENFKMNTVFKPKSENLCVIDSGCPKSVMSSLWNNIYQQTIRSIPKYIFKDVPETELFKFEPIKVYTIHRVYTSGIYYGVYLVVIY